MQFLILRLGFMPRILLLRRRSFTVIVIYTPSLPTISQIDEICNSFERNFYKIVVKIEKSRFLAVIW